MSVDPFTVIGLAGVVGYVASYALLQFGVVDGNGVGYSIANVAAASLVLISLVHDFNLASALIQIVWIVAGTVGLALRLTRHRSVSAIGLDDHALASGQGRVPRIDDRAAFRAASQTLEPTPRVDLAS